MRQESQEKKDREFHKFQQQIKESQQQNNNIKNTHKRDIENISEKL